MKHGGQAILAVVALFLLCAGLLFPILWWSKPKRQSDADTSPRSPLATVLPQFVEDWSVRDLPLGDTELLRAEVKRILNYTDYVYRRFERHEIYFEVYAGRWSRGAIPVRMLSTHVPDNCWTSSGWQCHAMRFADHVELDHKVFLPAQWRKFSSPQGISVQVWYWHLVGGKLYDYGSRFNQTAHPWRRVRDTFHELREGDPAQLFVRITANVSIERLARESCFRTVMHLLGGEGLYKVEATLN
jgi:hypothetical protein